MESYKLKFHKNRHLLTAMICIPVGCSVLMFAILYCLPTTFSQGYAICLISFILILMAVFFLWMINTQLVVNSLVSINNRGISFEITHANLFYKSKCFSAAWDEVDSIAEKFDSRNGSYYYQITFKDYGFKANFNALSNAEDEGERFFTELRYYQETLHLSPEHKQSKQNHQPSFG